MKKVETSSSHNEDDLSEGSTTKTTDIVKQKNVVRNSLIAGSVAGIASTITVHPFDVLRVKMQSSAPATMAPGSTKKTRVVGLMGTLRNTLHCGGGIRALYVGLATPLAAQAVFKGTVFTVNNITELYIRDFKTRNRHQGRNESPYSLTLFDRFISGFMGGAINAALFCTPIEYVRNHQIVQIPNNKHSTTPIADNGGRAASKKTKIAGGMTKGRHQNGPIAVIKHTIETNGFRGLWRGTASAVLRDSVGLGFFFATMAYSQEHLTPDDSTGPPQTGVLMLSGALAGVSFWLWALPVDTMKTWIQNGTARNIPDAIRMSQRDGLAQSIHSLFSGWQAGYSRGAASAAITVWSYSLAFQHLQGHT